MGLPCDSGSQMGAEVASSSLCPQLFPAHTQTPFGHRRRTKHTRNAHLARTRTHTAPIPTRSRVSKMVLNGSAGGRRFDEPDQDGVMRKLIREHVSKHATRLKQMRVGSLTPRRFTASCSSGLTENTSQIDGTKIYKLKIMLY